MADWPFNFTNPEDIMDPLEKFIASQISPDADELRAITSRFEERDVVKGRHVLLPGQPATEYFFVASGALRVYFRKGAKELTGWVAVENTFFTDLASLRKGTPSAFGIQAIEDSTVLTISDSDMEMLYRKFPVWQEFGRRVWETAFLNVLDATIAHQTLTSHERYLKMMEGSDLLQRLPLKDLSTFLGITPTSLSRLRGKRKE